MTTITLLITLAMFIGAAGFAWVATRTIENILGPVTDERWHD